MHRGPVQGRTPPSRLDRVGTVDVDAHDGQIEIGPFLDARRTFRHGSTRHVVCPRLVRPQVAVTLGVLDELGQDPQCLGGGPGAAVHDVAARDGQPECGGGPLDVAQGSEHERHQRATSTAHHVEVAHLGRFDEDGPVRAAKPSTHTRASAITPSASKWSTETASTPSGQNVGRASARRTIPAETSCHSSSGVGVPGQCDRARTVPGGGRRPR